MMDSVEKCATLNSLLELAYSKIESTRDSVFEIKDWKELTKINRDLAIIKDGDFRKIVYIYKYINKKIDTILPIIVKIIAAYDNNKNSIDKQREKFLSIVSDEADKIVHFEEEEVHEKINKQREYEELLHEAVRFYNSMDCKFELEPGENERVLTGYLDEINEKSEWPVSLENLNSEYERANRKLKELQDELSEIQRKKNAKAEELMHELNSNAFSEIKQLVLELQKVCTGDHKQNLKFNDLFRDKGDCKKVIKVVKEEVASGQKIQRRDAAAIFYFLDNSKRLVTVKQYMFLELFNRDYPDLYANTANKNVKKWIRTWISEKLEKEFGEGSEK